MNVYWKDANGNDETFWEHEWGKHGTCISTLAVSCYTGYTPQEEVVDYFSTTVNLYKNLDSYTVGTVGQDGVDVSAKWISSSLQPASSPRPPRHTLLQPSLPL